MNGGINMDNLAESTGECVDLADATSDGMTLNWISELLAGGTMRKDVEAMREFLSLKASNIWLRNEKKKNPLKGGNTESGQWKGMHIACCPGCILLKSDVSKQGYWIEAKENFADMCTNANRPIFEANSSELTGLCCILLKHLGLFKKSGSSSGADLLLLVVLLKEVPLFTENIAADLLNICHTIMDSLCSDVYNGVCRMENCVKLRKNKHISEETNSISKTASSCCCCFECRCCKLRFVFTSFLFISEYQKRSIGFPCSQTSTHHLITLGTQSLALLRQLRLREHLSELEGVGLYAHSVSGSIPSVKNNHADINETSFKGDFVGHGVDSCCCLPRTSSCGQNFDRGLCHCENSIALEVATEILSLLARCFVRTPSLVERVFASYLSGFHAQGSTNTQKGKKGKGKFGTSDGFYEGKNAPFALSHNGKLSSNLILDLWRCLGAIHWDLEYMRYIPNAYELTQESQGRCLRFIHVGQACFEIFVNRAFSNSETAILTANQLGCYSWAAELTRQHQGKGALIRQLKCRDDVSNTDRVHLKSNLNEDEFATASSNSDGYFELSLSSLCNSPITKAAATLCMWMYSVSQNGAKCLCHLSSSPLSRLEFSLEYLVGNCLALKGMLDTVPNAVDALLHRRDLRLLRSKNKQLKQNGVNVYRDIADEACLRNSPPKEADGITNIITVNSDRAAPAALDACLVLFRVLFRTWDITNTLRPHHTEVSKAAVNGIEKLIFSECNGCGGVEKNTPDIVFRSLTMAWLTFFEKCCWNSLIKFWGRVVSSPLFNIRLVEIEPHSEAFKWVFFKAVDTIPWVLVRAYKFQAERSAYIVGIQHPSIDCSHKNSRSLEICQQSSYSGPNHSEYSDRESCSCNSSHNGYDSVATSKLVLNTLWECVCLFIKIFGSDVEHMLRILLPIIEWNTVACICEMTMANSEEFDVLKVLEAMCYTNSITQTKLEEKFNGTNDGCLRAARMIIETCGNLNDIPAVLPALLNMVKWGESSNRNFGAYFCTESNRFIRTLSFLFDLRLSESIISQTEQLLGPQVPSVLEVLSSACLCETKGLKDEIQALFFPKLNKVYNKFSEGFHKSRKSSMCAEEANELRTCVVFDGKQGKEYIENVGDIFFSLLCRCICLSGIMSLCAGCLTGISNKDSEQIHRIYPDPIKAAEALLECLDVYQETLSLCFSFQGTNSVDALIGPSSCMNCDEKFNLSVLPKKIFVLGCTKHILTCAGRIMLRGLFDFSLGLGSFFAKLSTLLTPVQLLIQEYPELSTYLFTVTDRRLDAINQRKNTKNRKKYTCVKNQLSSVSISALRNWLTFLRDRGPLLSLSKNSANECAFESASVDITSLFSGTECNDLNADSAGKHFDFLMKQQNSAAHFGFSDDIISAAMEIQQQELCIVAARMTLASIVAFSARVGRNILGKGHLEGSLTACERMIVLTGVQAALLLVSSWPVGLDYWSQQVSSSSSDLLVDCCFVETSDILMLLFSGVGCCRQLNTGRLGCLKDMHYDYNNHQILSERDISPFKIRLWQLVFSEKLIPFLSFICMPVALENLEALVTKTVVGTYAFDCIFSCIDSGVEDLKYCPDCGATVSACLIDSVVYLVLRPCLVSLTLRNISKILIGTERWGRFGRFAPRDVQNDLLLTRRLSDCLEIFRLRKPLLRVLEIHIDSAVQDLSLFLDTSLTELSLNDLEHMSGLICQVGAVSEVINQHFLSSRVWTEPCDCSPYSCFNSSDFFKDKWLTCAKCENLNLFFLRIVQSFYRLLWVMQDLETIVQFSDSDIGHCISTLGCRVGCQQRKKLSPPNAYHKGLVTRQFLYKISRQLYTCVSWCIRSLSIICSSDLRAAAWIATRWGDEVTDYANEEAFFMRKCFLNYKKCNVKDTNICITEMNETVIKLPRKGMKHLEVQRRATPLSAFLDISSTANQGLASYELVAAESNEMTVNVQIADLSWSCCTALCVCTCCSANRCSSLGISLRSGVNDVTEACGFNFTQLQCSILLLIFGPLLDALGQGRSEAVKDLKRKGKIKRLMKLIEEAGASAVQFIDTVFHLSSNHFEALSSKNVQDLCYEDKMEESDRQKILLIGGAVSLISRMTQHVIAHVNSLPSTVFHKVRTAKEHEDKDADDVDCKGHLGKRRKTCVKDGTHKSLCFVVLRAVKRVLDLLATQIPLTRLLNFLLHTIPTHMKSECDEREIAFNNTTNAAIYLGVSLLEMSVQRLQLAHCCRSKIQELGSEFLTDVLCDDFNFNFAYGSHDFALCAFRDILKGEETFVENYDIEREVQHDEKTLIIFDSLEKLLIALGDFLRKLDVDERVSVNLMPETSNPIAGSQKLLIPLLLRCRARGGVRMLLSWVCRHWNNFFRFAVSGALEQRGNNYSVCDNEVTQLQQAHISNTNSLGKLTFRYYLASDGLRQRSGNLTRELVVLLLNLEASRFHFVSLISQLSERDRRQGTAFNTPSGMPIHDAVRCSWIKDRSLFADVNENSALRWFLDACTQQTYWKDSKQAYVQFDRDATKIDFEEPWRWLITNIPARLLARILSTQVKCLDGAVADVARLCHERLNVYTSSSILRIYKSLSMAAACMQAYWCVSQSRSALVMALRPIFASEKTRASELGRYILYSFIAAARAVIDIERYIKPNLLATTFFQKIKQSENEGFQSNVIAEERMNCALPELEVLIAFIRARAMQMLGGAWKCATLAVGLTASQANTVVRSKAREHGDSNDSLRALSQEILFFSEQQASLIRQLGVEFSGTPSDYTREQMQQFRGICWEVFELHIISVCSSSSYSITMLYKTPKFDLTQRQTSVCVQVILNMAFALPKFICSNRITLSILDSLRRLVSFFCEHRSTTPRLLLYLANELLFVRRQLKLTSLTLNNEHGNDKSGKGDVFDVKGALFELDSEKQRNILPTREILEKTTFSLSSIIYEIFEGACAWGYDRKLVEEVSMHILEPTRSEFFNELDYYHKHVMYKGKA